MATRLISIQKTVEQEERFCDICSKQFTYRPQEVAGAGDGEWARQTGNKNPQEYYDDFLYLLDKEVHTSCVLKAIPSLAL